MIIDIIKYLIFGVVQGFTEPLPISSSGHLVLIRYIFNTDAFDDLTFEIMLNFASFVAIVFLFRKDILKLIRSFFRYIFKKEERKKKDVANHFKYAMMIIVGSIPAGIIGIVFKDMIEQYLSNIKILGVAFLVTALMLFLVRNINGKKKDEDIGVKDAIIIGLFQMIALFPGISRSGSVLVGCLTRKLDRDAAIKYAFMLYLPVSIGSFLISIPDLMDVSTDMLLPYLIGFLGSMFMTYFASKWFFGIVKRGKLAKFSIYLVILAIVILIFL